MDIRVIRGEGTSPGEDIVEALLTNIDAGLSRGRAELDEGALADEQKLEIILQDIRLGQLVEVDDSILGHWHGKVTSITHTVSVSDEGNIDATTNLSLRKPR